MCTMRQRCRSSGESPRARPIIMSLIAREPWLPPTTRRLRCLSPLHENPLVGSAGPACGLCWSHSRTGMPVVVAGVLVRVTRVLANETAT